MLLFKQVRQNTEMTQSTTCFPW